MEDGPDGMDEVINSLNPKGPDLTRDTLRIPSFPSFSDLSEPSGGTGDPNR